MTKQATKPRRKAQDALYVRTDISPEEAFRAIGRLRSEARAEIDRLIRFLDDTDSHMEREPDEDMEPSLGSADNAYFDQPRWAAGNRADLEQDDGESGIGDHDGLAEQIGSQDWRQGGMF